MVSNLHRVLELVGSGFQRHRVLVVGDLMLDTYVWGEVSRISPEAPVPVLRSVRRSHVPGGAANVAMNLAGLGVQVYLAGFSGNDEVGSTLRDLLALSGISADSVCRWQRPTISKTRIMAGRQQLMRLDVETPTNPSLAEIDNLLECIGSQIDGAESIILSFRLRERRAAGARLPICHCASAVAEHSRAGGPQGQ